MPTREQAELQFERDGEAVVRDRVYNEKRAYNSEWRELAVAWLASLDQEREIAEALAAAENTDLVRRTTLAAEHAASAATEANSLAETANQHSATANKIAWLALAISALALVLSLVGVIAALRPRLG